jgi:hypothetical protein
VCSKKHTVDYVSCRKQLFVKFQLLPSMMAFFDSIFQAQVAMHTVKQIRRINLDSRIDLDDEADHKSTAVPLVQAQAQVAGSPTQRSSEHFRPVKMM